MERFMVLFISVLLFMLTGIAFSGTASQQATTKVHAAAQTSGY